MMGTSPEARREPNLLVRWSGLGVLLFAGIAIGYAGWSMYGATEPTAILDVVGAVAANPGPPPMRRPGSVAATESCRLFGPIFLTPAMNPIRADLEAGYSPVGRTRGSFMIAMLDANGRTLWERRGTIGSPRDDGTFVTSSAQLVDFSIDHAGGYTFEVGFPEGSLDDLREARIEIRRARSPIDHRVTWGFGLASLACLLVNLLSPKSESYAHPIVRNDREEWRDAA